MNTEHTIIYAEYSWGTYPSRDLRVVAIVSTLEEEDLDGDLYTVIRDGLCDYGEDLAEDLSTGPTPWERDRLTEVAMQLSLCPIHFCDWAICFDDENPDCDQIRAIFPHNHDT